MSKGADPAGRQKHEVAAALEPLREAVTGTEPKVCCRLDTLHTDSDSWQL